MAPTLMDLLPPPSLGNPPTRHGTSSSSSAPYGHSTAPERGLDKKSGVILGSVLGGVVVLLLLSWIVSTINVHRKIVNAKPLHIVVADFIAKIVCRGIPKNPGYASRVRKAIKKYHTRRIVNVDNGNRGYPEGREQNDPTQWGWGLEGVGDEPARFNQDYGNPDRDDLRDRETRQDERGGVQPGMGGRLGQTTRPRSPVRPTLPPQRRESMDGADDNAGEGPSRTVLRSYPDDNAGEGSSRGVPPRRERTQRVRWAADVEMLPLGQGRGELLRYVMRSAPPDPQPFLRSSPPVYAMHGALPGPQSTSRSSIGTRRHRRSRGALPMPSTPPPPYRSLFQTQQTPTQNNATQTESDNNNTDELTTALPTTTSRSRPSTTSSSNQMPRPSNMPPSHPVQMTTAHIRPATPMSVMLGDGTTDVSDTTEQAHVQQASRENKSPQDATDNDSTVKAGSDTADTSNNSNSLASEHVASTHDTSNPTDTIISQHSIIDAHDRLQSSPTLGVEDSEDIE